MNDMSANSTAMAAARGEAPPPSPPPPRPAPSPAAATLERAYEALRNRRLGEADGICRDILAAHPGLAAAQGLRGSVALLSGDHTLAIEMLEPAIRADPGNAGWRSSLSDAYRMVNRLDEALALGRDVIGRHPRNAAFLINLAKVHYDRSEWRDALAHFLGALAAAPDNANAHLGIGQILLARGQFRPGWIEYEWRNKLDQAQGRHPPINAAAWNGMDLEDGRILLIGDQGFGDTLQFCRYIPMVASRCKEVLVGCAADLVALMQTVDGVGRVFSRWGDIPGFTSHLLMSSLPYVFGSDAATIPSATPYLHADAAKVARWRERLAATGHPGMRVGLFWSGRPTHPNNMRRSMALAQLLPLADVPGLQFVSLQKEVPGWDAASLRDFPRMVAFPDALGDFGETAALIGNLDLVITVDSAVAHLAGALNRPVWVMTPTPADWRWMLDRTDSPWYPSLRLFRQPRPGRWPETVAAVRDALAAWPGRR